MKQLLIYLLPLVTLGIIVLAVIYLSRRFAFFFDLSSPKVLYWSFSAVAIFMMAGLILFTNTTNYALSSLYILAALSIGLLLYLLLATLGVDMVKQFTSLSPRIYGTTAIAITLMVSSYGVWNAWNIRTSSYDIEMEGLTQSVKAVHLSDIHIGHFRGHRFMESIVTKTQAVNPDVVFITGDLFDGKIRLNMEAIAPLKKLSMPIYFVEGNHDGYSNVKEVKEKLRKTGIQVLSNEKKELLGLQIIGLNHSLADENTVDIHAEPSNGTIKSSLNRLNINEDQAAILLHHSPDGISYAEKAGIDLYLAGHTHAGQLFPINYIAHFMFAYNRGLHQYKNTQILVSEGVGTFGPPMRVGTKSEIVVLNLKGK